MKRTLVVLVAVAALGLGLLCLIQAQKRSRQQVQLASLRGELEARSQQVEDLQAAQQRAEQRRQELSSQAEDLAAQLRAREFAATNVTVAPPAEPAPPPVAAKPDPGEGGLGKVLASMMNKPETREFIRNQQGMMMDQLYGPLIKKMGLTADEAAQLKDLLVDNAMKGAEHASAMFGGPDSTNTAAAVKKLTAQQSATDEQVKALLGDGRYAQYKAYQETTSERMQLNAFKTQVGDSYNLTEPQTEALLTFMKEERDNVAATTGLPLDPADKDPAKLQALFSGDKVDQLIQAQETIGQRVYERARTIFSPEQLETVRRFQTNQTQMIRVGLSMMRSFSGSAKAGAAASSAGP